MILKELIAEITEKGACAKSTTMTNWRSAAWLFFSPQGREFCEDNNSPSYPLWRMIQISHDMSEYGIYIDSGELSRKNDTDIALIGKTRGELIFDANDVVHKVILMHGAKAYIHASNHVVLLIVNIGNGNEIIIDKDETVVVL